MKNITEQNSSVAPSEHLEVLPALEVSEYVEMPVVPFRIWVNREMKAAYPDLPTGVLPAILGKRFQRELDKHGKGLLKGDSKVVAGMEFLTLNSITSAESLFGRWLSNKVATKQGEMNAIIRNLASSLRAEYPDEKLEYKASVSLVYDILNSKAAEKFEVFADIHNLEILELYRLANTATDESTQNLLRATFMICQRVEPDWALADSLQLTQDEIDEIILFWETENNKGVPPEKPEEKTEVADSEDEPKDETPEAVAEEVKKE